MSSFRYYISNIIILFIILFFILYIHKTASSLINTNHKLPKILDKLPDSQNYTKHKHIPTKIIQQLVCEESSKSKRGIKLQKTFHQKSKDTKSENVSITKYNGGGPVEKQNIPLLKTQNPNLSTKPTTTRSKYEKHIFNLKTLFLHEDSTAFKQNEAKDELGSLFTKPHIFINEEDLKKFDKYIKGNLFKALNMPGNINFEREFWSNFVDYDFEKFKNILVSLVKKYNAIHQITFVQTKAITLTDPHLSKMENNTCFVISLLYMIKTNSQLQNLINVYCNDENYKQCLFKLLDKKDNEPITEEEFNVLTNTSDTTTREFKFNEQNDSVYLLESILFDKCNLIYNQFSFLGELIVSKKGLIVHDDISFNVPKFNASIYGPIMPIIELYIRDPNFKYDIQDILWGQKSNVITNDDTWYSIPLFLKSPIFLGLKINIGGFDTTEKIICRKPTGKKDEKGNDIMINKEKTIYNFLPYGDFVFQEEIFIRSLSEGKTKYILTGFLLYELSRKPGILGGHYIPYYKLNGNWYCTYLEYRKTGQDVLPEFPLLFNFNKSYIVSMLFYEKVYNK